MTDQPRMSKQAKISDDGHYRYSLHRDWHQPEDLGWRWATFVMLNPSTADAEIDDPTIRRCIGFARALECTGLVVINLYAWRATDPGAMWSAQREGVDIVGPENDDVLRQYLAMSARYDGPLIAGWGVHALANRVAAIMRMPGSDRMTALRTTQSGAPGHPLYIPGAARPVPWAPPAGDR